MRQTLRSVRSRPGLLAGGFLLTSLGLSAVAADGPAVGAPLAAVLPTTRPAPRTPTELFDVAAVWTIHLTFSPDQWAAMEPKGGGGPFGGPPGPGPGPGGGPGAPGGGRPPAFGPSMFIAPAFMKDGDRDADGKLTRDEFRGLAERWFAAWDKDKAGKVDGDGLRAGLNATLGAPQGFGGPPGGGPGGRPGGGNRGIGINLQGAEGKRNGLASAVGIEFAYVHADLDFQGQALKDVAVRYKGNGTFLQSRAQLKRSMKLDLNRFADAHRVAGVTALNLHSNVTDASWMNEVLSHRLYRDAGVPAPRTAYARVYVTVPGTHDRAYLGLYSVVEDVGKGFATDRFKTEAGAVFKPVTPELFADLGDDWAKYNQTYDPKTHLTDPQKRRVIEFARLVTAADDAAFAARVGDYLDLEAFARYMAVTTYLSTLDSILAVGQNYYLYLHPGTNKFQFVPWDLDHSFGQFPLIGSQAQREGLSVRKPWRGENRFLERTFRVDAFRALYLTRLKELTGSAFRPERLQAQVDEVAAAIRGAVKDESAEKVARFDQVVAGQAVEPAGFGPGGGAGGGPPGGGFGFGQVKPIKSFVTSRWRSVSEQLAGTSQGQTIDGGGLGGPGGPGGPPGDFGPGTFLGPAFLAMFDADKDKSLSRAEAVSGFLKWFDTWDADKTGELTDEKLRAGMDRQFSPTRFGG